MVIQRPEYLEFLKEWKDQQIISDLTDSLKDLQDIRDILKNKV